MRFRGILLTGDRTSGDPHESPTRAAAGFFGVSFVHMSEEMQVTDAVLQQPVGGELDGYL